MNTFLISIGSNENRDENIRQSQCILKELYPDIVFSELVETEPIGDVYKSDFYNQLAVFNTSDSEEKVTKHLKDIEKQLGRLNTDKLIGIVKVDLDLLAINTKIISDDVFERPYLKTLLKDFDVSLSRYLDSTGYFAAN